MAPNAKVIAFENSKLDPILLMMTQNPTVNQFSSSSVKAYDSGTEALFLVLASQGKTFFTSTSDFGSWQPPALLFRAELAQIEAGTLPVRPGLVTATFKRCHT